MKRARPILAALILIALLLGIAGLCNIRLFHLRSEYALTQTIPTENLPPAIAFTTVAFGGFRGILADSLWMRATTLQEEGRYFELVQLAEWITLLQPRSPDIWAYQSWNLAYNIPALLSNPEEKWHWVRHGIRLLGEDGLRLNPGSARLYTDLAWLFLHKLGADLDPAAPVYRRHLITAPPLIVTEPGRHRTEAALGTALDWNTPQAYAIHFALTGLPHARTDADDLALRRITYQALLQLLAQGQETYRPAAIAFLTDAITRHPAQTTLRDIRASLQNP